MEGGCVRLGQNLPLRRKQENRVGRDTEEDWGIEVGGKWNFSVYLSVVP